MSQFGFVALHFLLYLLAKAIPKTDRLREKVSSYLYWNGTIRFVMEGYMDIVLFSMLNIEDLNWEDSFWAVKVSNYLAIVLTAVLSGLPIFFIIFYGRNLKNWNASRFQSKYGALLDGTNQSMKEKQWIVLLIPISYFLRRLGMCLCLVFWKEFFWGQVAIQLACSVGLIILIGWYMPLSSGFANWMELFNESITLCTLYLMMCFSDYVLDPETRSVAGLMFIVVLCLYAALHMFFLVLNLCSQIRHFIRSKYYARRNKKILEERQKRAGRASKYKQ